MTRNHLIAGLLLAACLFLAITLVASRETPEEQTRTLETRETHDGHNHTLVGGFRQSAASLFDRIRGANSTTTTSTIAPNDDDDDDDDDDGDDDVDETEEEKIVNANKKSSSSAANSIAARSSATQKRELGLLALLLGPLIGITIGKALFKGLVWALVAYALHLFFPGVLSLLGLGTGLVGFARNMRPDYAQLIVHTLINLHDEFHRLPPVPLNGGAGHQLVHRHY